MIYVFYHDASSTMSCVFLFYSFCVSASSSFSISAMKTHYPSHCPLNRMKYRYHRHSLNRRCLRNLWYHPHHHFDA